jgi:hypothetical protein
MEKSTLDAVLAHIGRIESELASLKATVTRLGESGDTSAAPVASAVAAAAAAPVAAAQSGKHRSGLPMELGTLVSRLFEVALMENGDDKWDSFVAISHADALVGPRSLEFLKAFNWKQFSKNAHSYLTDGQVDSFIVTKSEPEDTSSANKVKLFLKPGGGRHPAPLHLSKDSEQGGAWRVEQVAL